MSPKRSTPDIFTGVSEVKGSLNSLLTAAAERPHDDLALTKDNVGDQLDRFLLWAGDLDAMRSAEFQSSLEDRLSEAPELEEQIFRMFTDIEEGVRDLQAILAGERPNRQIASVPGSSCGSIDDRKSDGELTCSDVDSDAGDEAHMILAVISQSITMLFKISSIIRKTGTRDRFIEALQISEALPDASDIDYVMSKHPKLPDNGLEYVAERMGSAIAKRRQFIKYCSVRDENVEDNHPLATLKLDTPQKGTASTQRQGPESVSAKASTELKTDNFVPLHADNVPPLDQGTYRKTTSTGYTTLAHLKLPELAKRAEQNEPVKCPVCFTVQPLRGVKSWRAHVFSDLRPYLCTIGDGDCRDLLFGDIDSWFNHELEHHRSHHVCIMCHPSPEFDAEEFCSHALDAHGLSDPGQVKSLQELGRRLPDSFTPDECPFCDEWADALRTEHEVSQQADRHWSTVSPDEFKEHVGMHQEELAIVAIYPEDEGGISPAPASEKKGLDLQKDLISTLSLLRPDDNLEESYPTPDPARVDIRPGTPEEQQHPWIMNSEPGERDSEYRVDPRYPIHCFDFIHGTVQDLDEFKSILARERGYSSIFIHHTNERLGFLISSRADPKYLTVIENLSKFDSKPWPEGLRPKFPMFSIESIGIMLSGACGHNDSGYFAWAWEHHLSIYPYHRLDNISWEQSSMLFTAVEARHPEMVRLCLDSGADPNALRDGESPWASGGDEDPARDEDTSKPVITSAKNDTAMHLAAEAGLLNIVQILVTAGALVEVKSRGGKTPLWLAAYNQHMEVFEYLVSLDADPEAPDSNGTTPLAVLFASEQG